MTDKLISLQAAVDSIEEYFEGLPIVARYELLEIIKDLPEAVIRCKDCRHYNAGFECLIEGYGIERNREWYCGDAERKDGETDG